MRLNLNYGWKYSPEWSQDLINNEFDDSSFVTVNIPHANKEIPYNYFDEKMYQFVSGYRNTFDVPASYAGKRLVLEFEAVANYAIVYVNGVEAMSHKGSYTSFNADVTDLIKIGEINTVTVMVDSTEREEIPPFGNAIDYLVYGGIYREVYLYIMEEDHVQSAMIAPMDVLTKNIHCDIKITLNKTSSMPIQAKLIDRNGKVIHEKAVENDGSSNVINTTIKTGNVNLWSIENPYLYTVELSYAGATYSYKFGFREAKFTKKGFLLNGKPVKIRGLNRHQSFPHVGYAMPASAQIADADYCKNDLGLNLVRTSHYPNSHHFLNRCDEIGLLVFTEIPGWQYVSKDNEEWRKIAVESVREMIDQDYNHPSIIIWGVRINESIDDHDLYTKTNALAHELDKTRQTGGVRCTPQSELLEDVYTYNDFIHSGSNRGLLPKFLTTKLSAPLLITEHNGHMFPTKSFDVEKRRQEHALRHATVLNTAYRRDNTCGAIGWCMSDYNTHKDFGSGDKICYHGVSDMFRMDKLAAYVYKSQQDEYPVVELTSNMEIGDNNGGQVGNVYIFTNCETIDVYKNGSLIDTIHVANDAKKSEWKHLPHPPIKLYDIIGNQLELSGKFTKKDSARVKKLLLDIKSSGPVGAVISNLGMALKLFTKYKMDISSITALFGEYVTGWGAKAVSYRLEGKLNNQVAVISKEPISSQHIQVKADATTLIEDDTYDTTRIAIRAVSQVGANAQYSNETIKVDITGPIEIIGDSTFSLIGGARAFWIKSIGKSGEATVTITSNIGSETIDFNVQKIDVVNPIPVEKA